MPGIRAFQICSAGVGPGPVPCFREEDILVEVKVVLRMVGDIRIRFCPTLQQILSFCMNIVAA